MAEPGAVDICAVPLGACTDSRHWLFNCLATTSAAEILVAVRLSACARSVGLVVVPVRLLPVVSLGEKGMRKIPLVTELSVFSKNSELAQVLRKCVIGRYLQLKLLKAKGTEVAQPRIASSY